LLSVIPAGRPYQLSPQSSVKIINVQQFMGCRRPQSPL